MKSNIRNEENTTDNGIEKDKMSLKEQERLFEISRSSSDFGHFFPQKSLEKVIDAG